MAILLKDSKLLFILVPGTASSTIGNELLAKGGEFLPKESVFNNGKLVVDVKHSSLKALVQHQFVEPDKYFVFSTIRHPLDRFVTYYARYEGAWLENYQHWFLKGLETTEMDSSAKEKHRQWFYYNLRKKKRRQFLIRKIGFNLWFQFTVIRKRVQGKSKLRRFAFPLIEGVDAAIYYEDLERGLNEIISRHGNHSPISLRRKNITEGKKAFKSYYNVFSRVLISLVMKGLLNDFGYDLFDKKIDGSVRYFK
jgi:hypothetical protein